MNNIIRRYICVPGSMRVRLYFPVIAASYWESSKVTRTFVKVLFSFSVFSLLRFLLLLVAFELNSKEKGIEREEEEFVLFFGREIKNHGITVLLRIGLPGELRDFYNPASLSPLLRKCPCCCCCCVRKKSVLKIKKKKRKETWSRNTRTK